MIGEHEGTLFGGGIQISLEMKKAVDHVTEQFPLPGFSESCGLTKGSIETDDELSHSIPMGESNNVGCGRIVQESGMNIGNGLIVNDISTVSNSPRT